MRTNSGLVIAGPLFHSPILRQTHVKPYGAEFFETFWLVLGGCVRPFLRDGRPLMDQESPKAFQPAWPSFSRVWMFCSKMASASGKAATARSTLSSRNKCRIANGARLV